MIRRVLTVLAVLAAVLLSAPPAQALDIPNPLGDCKGEAPAAQAPGTGTSALFATPPKSAPKGPAFVNGSPSYAHYGTAGYRFGTYDLGCGPDAFRDPGGVTGVLAGNWAFEVSKFTIAATAAFLGAAYNPTYMSVFDDLLVTGVDTLTTAIFDEWIVLSVALVGLAVILGARKGKLSGAVTSVGWALLVMIVATFLFSYPVKAGEMADGTVAATLGEVNDGINGGGEQTAAQSAATSLTSAVLWEEWKMGTFGSGNSGTADKYAERLYKAQTLTWAEAAKVQAGDEGILEDKADDWTKIAGEIEESDPDAYNYLRGVNGETRFGAGVVSLAALVATAPFMLMSGLLLIGSYLVIRLVVLFFPAVAVIGVLWRARGAVIGIGTVVAAAVLNSLMFGIAAAVDVLAARILLSPEAGIPLWLALGLMLVLSLILWVMTKPVRRLTSLANPSKVIADGPASVGDSVRKAKDSTMSMAKTAVAAYAGGAGGAKMMAEHEEKKAQEQRTEGRANDPSPVVVPTAAGLPGGANDRGALPAGSPPPPPPPMLPSGSGSIPMPAPAASVGGTAADSGEIRGVLASTPIGAIGAAEPQRPVRTDDPTGPIFVPGATTEPLQPVTLPRIVEPSIDDAGEEVYTLFEPKMDDAE